MATIVTINDLPTAVQSAELVDAMIDGANAKASRVAPCLTWDGSDTTKPRPSADQIAEARLILIGAIKRWTEAGAGSFQQQSVGPFAVAVDTRQRSGFNLWPSEIQGLQEICKATQSPSGFTVDTAPALGGTHAPWCSVNFGATYCSCGADIAGAPIYEV